MNKYGRLYGLSLFPTYVLNTLKAENRCPLGGDDHSGKGGICCADVLPSSKGNGGEAASLMETGQQRPQAGLGKGVKGSKGKVRSELKTNNV